jgi:hypothetical protein
MSLEEYQKNIGKHGEPVGGEKKWPLESSSLLSHDSVMRLRLAIEWIVNEKSKELRIA